MIKNVLVIILAFFVISCAKSTPETVLTDTYIDPSLSMLKEVTVVPIVLEDGSTVLQIEAFNESLKPVSGWRRVEWFNSQGIRIDALNSKWIPFTAQPKTFLTMKTVSPAPEAVRYRIQLKRTLK